MTTIIRVSFLLALSALLAPDPTVASSASPLKFLLMVAKESNPDSSAIVSAVDQTLEDINADASILPGHRLEYILSDIQCNRTKALDSFFKVTTDSSVVAVVGCGCSSATEEVAKISHYSNISVISYASTSVVLSDRSVYRSFFRTVPSDELLVSAVVAIMNTYKWRKLSVFTEEQPQFVELNYLLRQTLQPMVNISEVYPTHEHDLLNYTQFADKISHVFDAQPHIFIPVASHRTKTFILCTAYHNGRFYPNYAWILLGHHDTDWWREHYMETNCTDTEMRNVLNRILVLIPYPDNNNIRSQNEYTEQIEQTELYNVSAYASDAVRALAEALHACFNSTTSGNISDNCRGAFLNWNITFTGNTGHVQFNQHNGNREATITILQQFQFRGERDFLKSVGLVLKSTNGTHQMTSIGNTSVWPDGPPPDGTPVVVIHTLSTFVTTVQSLLAGISLTTIVTGLVINIAFRKRKIVKLTSPKLNYFLLIGVTLMTLSALTYPSTEHVVNVFDCTSSRIFASVGYDICIGIALVKTWRVCYIFKNPSPDKTPPRDWQLLLVVLLIVVVDITFATPLLTLSLLSNDIVLKPSTRRDPKLNEQGVLENFFEERCNQSNFFLIFVGVSISYKFVLHAIGLALAYLIRKVKVTVLNDSQETVAIIYGSTLLLVVGTVVIMTLGQSSNFYSTIWSIMVFLVSMIHIGLTFVPKMVALYKDPQGKKVFRKIRRSIITKPMSGSTTTITKTNSIDLVDNDRIGTEPEVV